MDQNCLLADILQSGTVYDYGDSNLNWILSRFCGLRYELIFIFSVMYIVDSISAFTGWDSFEIFFWL